MCCSSIPTGRSPGLPQALGRSLAWVKKWRRRIRQAQARGEPLAEVLQGGSCAHKHPSKAIDPLVVERILAIGDQPPRSACTAPPGQKRSCIIYRATNSCKRQPCQGQRSSRTIYRILKKHGRIPERRPRKPDPQERNPPMAVWQADFKDINTVPPEPGGKRQHGVETLDIPDLGTSALLDAQVRPDFTAEVAIDAFVEPRLCYGCPASVVVDRDVRWVGSPAGSDFPSAFLRFCACLGIQTHVCAPHHPQENGFVERYHRTYQQECLAVQRPSTLEQAREVTEAFVQHYNFQRPNQALSCGNQPPRSAFPTLPALRPLPQIVDPDSWLEELHGWHVERKVDAHGTIRSDLKPYSISSKLAGQRLTVQLDAKAQCLHVFQGTQRLKSVPITRSACARQPGRLSARPGRPSAHRLPQFLA